MHTTLYMASSPSGMIARNNEETNWSEAEWELYISTLRSHGTLIVGSRTYQIMLSDNELKGLEDLPIIVVSAKGTKIHRKPDIVVSSPKEALSQCEEKGFNNPIIGGGSTLNASFLEAALIDELIIDYEPILFSPGKLLCGGAKIELPLTLKSVKTYGDSGVQLRYLLEKQRSSRRGIYIPRPLTPPDVRFRIRRFIKLP